MLGGLALAVLAVVLLLLRDGPTEEPVTSDALVERPTLPTSVTPPATPMPPPQRPADSPSGSTPTVKKTRKSLIESVEVSPRQPCRDEEVLVEVRLKPEAKEAKTSIRGRMGSRAVFVFDRAGPVDLHVLADDWADGLDSRSVRVSIGECPAPPRLLITTESVGPSSYRFTATATTGARLDQVRWRIGEEAWSPGGPALERSFALRPQRSTSETLLIEAEAGRLRGRTTVFLVNQSHLTRLLGAPFLPVVASQFPERSGAHVLSRLETRNLFRAEGHFETLKLTTSPCDDGAPRELQLPAKDVLDHLTLRADEVDTFQVRLPADVVKDSCRVELRLEGTAEDQRFTALWGLATGVPKSAEAVTDPQLLQRLHRARHALGRTNITPTELEAFERTSPITPAAP